jgi:hypothetical protein
MAKIKCPHCGYTESDGRPHDRETYYEPCVVCEPPSRKATGKVFACTPADLSVKS